jgi:hypothetical protein
MYTDSLIEILSLLDLSTLQKISFKNKRLYDIYNCDSLWRMKLINEDLPDLNYLIDPLYSNSTLKEIYEQYEKYQRHFDILSNELRRNGLNHCYGRIVCDASECFDDRILSKRLLDQRDDIKTLSICKKRLTAGVHVPNSNKKPTMTIIADYVTSKFHKLMYLDISDNYFWFSTKNDTDINNVYDLKRILDHPSIIVVNISEYISIESVDSLLNERQLRKCIWIPERHIKNIENLERLETKSGIIKDSNEYFEKQFLYRHYMPNNIRHMKDDIITWHRQFYDIVKPYTPEEDIDSEYTCYL